MPHIHTNSGEHDLTTSAFIVRDDFPEPRLLLHMHKKLHVLMQPGGHVELNENPWQAIEHELSEETGYAFDDLEVLQPIERLRSLSNAELHPVPVLVNTHSIRTENAHKHTDITYAFVAHDEPQSQPQKDESLDLRWISSDELDNLASSEIFDGTREIGRYVLSTIISEWERIPAR